MKEFFEDIKYAIVALSVVAAFGITITLILLSK